MQKDIRKEIVKILRGHPEGLTINQIADEVGIHRHTLTKYIYELSGAQKISVRKVGVAKLCYINNRSKGRHLNSRTKKGQAGPVGLLLLLLFFSSLLTIIPPSQTSIKVLNPYSRPTLHGEWVINFTTSGYGPLMIRGVNGTSFEDSKGIDDLRFMELRCGARVIQPDTLGAAIIFKAHHCKGTSSLTLKELTSGSHDIEIHFGLSVDYAHNYADCTGTDVTTCHKCDVSQMDYLAYSDSGGFVSDGTMTSGGNPACTGTGDSQENFTYSLGYTFCPSEDAVRWIVVADAEGDTYEDEINTSLSSSVSTLIIDDFNDGSNAWTTGNLADVNEGGDIFYAYSTTTSPSMTLDVTDFEADSYKYAIVKARNVNATSQRFYLYWIGDQCASFSSTCGFVGITPMNVTNNDWHVYLFNLSADTQWTQTITQVRLYPFYAQTGVNFSIDYVILVSDIPDTLYTPDFDGDQNWCDCRFGSGYFNIGGETAATACCGDDSGEFKRTRQCDGEICTSDSSDDACCDDSTDCAYSSTCYTSGSYLPSTQGAICLNGTWTNSTPVSATPSLYYSNLTSATVFKRIGNATAQLNITDIEGAEGLSYVFGNLTKPDGSLGQNALFLSTASIPNGSTFRYAGSRDGLVAAYSFEEANQTYAFDLTNYSNDGSYYGETFNDGTLDYYENVIYDFDTPSAYYYIYQQADYAHTDAWWSTTWKYRKKITIDSSKIDSALSNFPVLVKLTSSNFDFSKARSDGYDLRFTTSSGTLLSYDRERWISGSSLGEVWVKIPSVSSSSDTYFYMYYDNDAASDGEDEANTWDANYKMVQHLEETSGTHYDETSNNNDGTNNGSNQDATGKIDGANDFDGIDDYIYIGQPASLDFKAPLTVEVWVNKDTVCDTTMPTEYAYRKDIVKGIDTWVLRCDERASTDFGSPGNTFAKGIHFEVQSASDSNYYCANGTIPAGSWHHIVGLHDGTYIKLYIDGSLATSVNVGSDLTDNTFDFSIGHHPSPSCHWDGYIDEVRMSNTARSAAWIKASYNTGADTLLTYGSEEEAYDHPSGNTNIYKEGTGAVKFNKTGQYYSWVLLYGNNVSAVNMQNKYTNIRLYIKDKDTLNKISKARLYLFDTYRTYTWYVYKDFAASTLGVGWNLLSFDTSSPTGSSGTPDLTQVGNFRFDIQTNQYSQKFQTGDIIIDDLFVTDSAPAGPTWKYGSSNCKYGNCLEFDGEDDYVNVTGLDWTPTKFSVEFWVYPLSRSDWNQQVKAVEGWDAFVFHTTSDGSVYVGTDISTRFTPTDLPANTVLLNQWQHFVFTFDNGAGKFYKNGNLLASKTGMTNPTAWGGFMLGSTGTNTINGTIDNVRVWDRALTASEINQSRDSPYPPGREGLVSWWPLDEGYGGNVHSDLAGSNHAALYGPASTVGKYEDGLYFDGSDDYVEVSDDDSLNITSSESITIGAWIKDKGDTNNHQGIAVKRTSTSNGFLFYVEDNTGNLRFKVADGSDSVNLDSGVNVFDDSWHYVVGILDRNAGNISIYIDGNFKNTTDASAVDGLNSSSVLRIGADSSANQYFFNGIIDNVRIWDRALTATEINDSRDSWKPPTTNGLVAWYPFDTTQKVPDTHWKVSGKYGAGASLDGSDDYIDCGNDTSLNINGTDITIEAWVYVNEFPPSSKNAAILGKQAYGTKGAAYGLIVSSTKKAGGVISNDSTTAAYTTSNLTIGEWYHLALTYNGSNMLVYLNGTLEKNQPKTGTIRNSSLKNLTFGAPTNLGIDVYFNGTIDDVRIYSRVLTAEEINQTMNMTFNPKDVGETPGTWTVYALVNDTARKSLVTSSTFTVEDNIPLYRAVMVNQSNETVDYGATVNMTAEILDDMSPGYAWLETNESGSWANQTCGPSCYDSTMYKSEMTSWTQANFTWRNSSILPGNDIGWRIWVNDSYTQVNGTDIQVLTVRDYNPPNYTNTQQNKSNPGILEGVNLSTDAYDEYLVQYALLETNESGGSWRNKTITFVDSGNQTVYYHWGNTSMYPWKTVKWRIWLNDSFGQYNVTDEFIFHLNLSELFDYTTGDRIYSSAAIGDIESDSVMDIIIGSDDDKVYAFNGTTGASKWNFSTGNNIGSSPTLADITGTTDLEVIFGSLDNKLYVIDSSGSELWSYTTDNMVWSSPAVIDIDGDSSKEIIIGSADNTLYVFGPDGTSEWNYTTDGIIWSSPVVTDLDGDSSLDVLIASYDDTLYALNKSGDSIWNFTASSDLESTPTVVDFGYAYKQVIIGSYDNNIYCLWANNGSQLWSYSGTEWFISSPNYGDIDGDSQNEVVIGGDDGVIYAFNADGSHLWNYTIPTGGRIESSPSLADMTGDGIWDVVVGSSDNYIYALNGSNGNLIWKYHVGGYVYSSPSMDDIMGFGRMDTVVGTLKNRVLVLDPAWDRFGGNAGRSRLVDDLPPQCEVRNTSIVWVDPGETVSIDTYWKDLYSNLGMAWFWENSTGNFTLISRNLLGLRSWFNNSITAPARGNRTVYYKVNVTDSFGNVGQISGYINVKQCESDDDCPLYHECRTYVCVYVPPKFAGQPALNKTEENKTATEGISIPTVVSEIQKIGYITADEIAEATFLDSRLDVQTIKVLTSEEASNVVISVERRSSAPSAEETAPATYDVYAYLTISTLNLQPEVIKKAEIDFRVNLTWLTENNTNPEDIILLRLHEGTWTRLVTNILRQDDDYAYYRSETPGFSIFAIAVEKPEAAPVCGDGTCEPGEETSCPSDCRAIEEEITEEPADEILPPELPEPEAPPTVTLFLVILSAALVTVYMILTHTENAFNKWRIKRSKTKKRKKRLHLLPALLVFMILAVMYVFMSQSQLIQPQTVSTSDGLILSPAAEIPRPSGLTGGLTALISASQEPRYAEVNLKTSPYGFAEADKWNTTLFEKEKSITAHVKWKTDMDAGAGNIYVGYSFDGENWEEKGPFGESGEENDVTFDLGSLNKVQLANLRLRFRGEDLDRMFPAFAYVKFYLEPY